MKRLFFLATASMAIVSPALAGVINENYIAQPPRLAARYQIGEAGSAASSRAAGDPYSNIQYFTGNVITNGSATNIDGNNITRLLADDINPGPFNRGDGARVTGQEVITIYFCVANNDKEDVTARPRLRFWNDIANTPGMYYDNSPSGSIGYTFNPMTFPPASVTCYFAVFQPGGASNLYLNGSKFWAGMTFDDNNGTTGAALDQLNQLGTGLFDPPTEGTSEDQMFLSDSAGSFFGVNNPAGTIGNFGGAPVANMGWAFELPEPATLGMLTFAVLVLLKRR